MAIIPKITAVSYLNTIPFVYGLQHADSLRADLSLAPPAECARRYMEEEADIALLPAAVVPELRETTIITDYCIGAVGAVRTVRRARHSLHRLCTPACSGVRLHQQRNGFRRASAAGGRCLGQRAHTALPYAFFAH